MKVSFDIWALIVFPSLFVFALAWPKPHGRVIEESRVTLVRRFCALNIDIFIGMLGVLPFICIPALWLEYLSTGVWSWTFERDFSRSTDIVFIILFLLGLYGIFYYFKWHFKNNKQTLGQHMLNFKLAPFHENPSMGMRAFVAWIVLAWWPFWPWTLFKAKQDYLWDDFSNIKARRVLRK